MNYLFIIHFLSVIVCFNPMFKLFSYKFDAKELFEIKIAFCTNIMFHKMYLHNVGIEKKEFFLF